MPDKKVPKAIKRQRFAREKRRFENVIEKKNESHQKLVDILSENGKRGPVTLFNEEEKKKYFSKPGAIGTVTCPLCGKANVLVINPLGIKGDYDRDYIKTHSKLRGSFDCDASGFLIKTFFKK